MPQVTVEPWWRALAFRNWLNEILKTWKRIKSLGSSTHLTKKLDKRGKGGCSCVSIVWLSGERLGQLTSTFIHFLCEKGRTVISREDGWEEVCGKLKSLKQPLWWIREGAKFLLCCSVSVIPYTASPWNVALAARLLFLRWNMFEMFAEPVHWVRCIWSNCHNTLLFYPPSYLCFTNLDYHWAAAPGSEKSALFLFTSAIYYRVILRRYTESWENIRKLGI